jgi:hypothetical protein
LRWQLRARKTIARNVSELFFGFFIRGQPPPRTIAAEGPGPYYLLTFLAMGALWTTSEKPSRINGGRGLGKKIPVWGFRPPGPTRSTAVHEYMTLTVQEMTAMAPRKPRLTVVRPGVDGRPNRLQPPPDLEPTGKRLFGDLVASCPPEHFRPSDLPLLIEYVRETVLARQAADEMSKSGGPVAGGVVNPWFGIWQRATRTMCVLSTRLRLNPQSRLHQKSVHRAVGYTPPSYYDRMGDDDVDPGS